MTCSNFYGDGKHSNSTTFKYIFSRFDDKLNINKKLKADGDITVL